LQLSIVDLMAASTIALSFATLNAIEFPFGSGIQGWPFTALTQHSVTGANVHWLGAITNTLLCIAVVVATAFWLGRNRRKAIADQPEIQTIEPSCHPLDEPTLEQPALDESNQE